MNFYMWHKTLLFIADFFHVLRPVSAVIVRRGNEFLIVKKNRKAFAWQFPQGGKEKGESFLQAAQRELSEECGSELKVVFRPLHSIFQYRYFFPKDFKRYTGQEVVFGVRAQFFFAEYVAGEVLINTQELCEFQWVKKEDIPKYVEPAYWQVVQSLLQ